jgi:hypothetical protein
LACGLVIPAPELCHTAHRTHSGLSDSGKRRVKGQGEWVVQLVHIAARTGLSSSARPGTMSCGSPIAIRPHLATMAKQNPHAFVGKEGEARHSAIDAALAFLVAHYKEQPSLEDTARVAGLSAYHFQRTFRAWTGLTPKRFIQYLQLTRAKDPLPSHHLEERRDSPLPMGHGSKTHHSRLGTGASHEQNAKVTARGGGSWTRRAPAGGGF